MPNPFHISKETYLAEARAAAQAAGRANGVEPARLQLDFPDAASFAPVRARAVVVARLDAPGAPAVEASAVAEAGASAGMTGMASGGGYGGPLVYRDGEGMRPDVAD